MNKTSVVVRNLLIKVGPPFVEGAVDGAPAGSVAGLRGLVVLLSVCVTSARSASTHLALACVVLVRVSVCDVSSGCVDAHGDGL